MRSFDDLAPVGWSAAQQHYLRYILFINPNLFPKESMHISTSARVREMAFSDGPHLAGALRDDRGGDGADEPVGAGGGQEAGVGGQAVPGGAGQDRQKRYFFSGHATFHNHLTLTMRA